MDPSLQLAIAAFGSIASTLTALAIVAILVRLLGEQQDTEILCEIRLLREEMKEHRRITNYIIFDHTANRIVGDVAGTVGPEGGVTKFRPFKIEPKYKAHRVRLLAILSDGEDAHLF